MDITEVMHWIAQGVINIEYGHTTIEKGSPVHKAMVALCEYFSNPDCLPMISRYILEGKQDG